MLRPDGCNSRVAAICRGNAVEDRLMAIQPPDPLLARLVAKLPKGKRSKKVIAMLPILAEIVAAQAKPGS